MVATKICVSLVESSAEEKKLAATESGILPALKLIIDDPPPLPSPIVSDHGLVEIEPELVPLPESPLYSGDGLANDVDSSLGLIHEGRTEISGNNDLDALGTPTNASEEKAHPASDITAKVDSAGEDKIRSIENADSHIEQFNPSAPDVSESSGLGLLHQEGDADGTVHNVGSSVGFETPNNPPKTTIEPSRHRRSPRAKGVTFDSVDRIISADTQQFTDENNSEDEPELVTSSPQSMHPMSLRGKSIELSQRSKAAAEALARQEARNKEEMYQQAFTALNYIIMDLTRGVLGAISEAYVAAGIHESLINTLKE